MTLWGGRFTQKSDQNFAKFNNSLYCDYRLAEQDIISSIAWAQSLLKIDIINTTEFNKIKSTLNTLLKEIKNNPKQILQSDAEDIHSWVELQLVKKLGELGKKLHTGRSRNDQVTTDLKLWCKKHIQLLLHSICQMQLVLINIAESNQSVIIPGYTHLQQAQPITFSHWCLAYFEMLDRDKHRVQDTLKRIDTCPLGSGALAGTAYNINRDQLAQSLGFSTATKNSLDSISDRDYVLELLSNATISMIHLSRFAEDLIFFNTSEFNFIELSDQFTSGSSLMPQKKNPDALELIRGKCGRVHGSLVSMITILKGLPLAYNKDMQEDKQLLFDSLDTWLNCLNISNLLLKDIKINILRCEKMVKNGYSNATDLADYLVKKGIAFREAHFIVGKIVLYAIQRNKIPIEKLELKELQNFSNLITKDVYSQIDIKTCMMKRNSVGGVSPYQISQAIIEAKKRVLA